MMLMSMLLSGPLLVGEHVVIESVIGESFEHVVIESVDVIYYESFITWC